RLRLNLASGVNRRRKPTALRRVHRIIDWPGTLHQCAHVASSSSATILVILLIGFTAGPAVSLYGSPTVSPVTAALWASEPLPPKWPSSMYFLALSHAPPPEVIEMATNKPVTITPISMAPSALKACALSCVT